MALAGQALIAIWNDILPESRADFFEWHPREHMVERLGIPGFLRGRRCIAVNDSTAVGDDGQTSGVEFLTLYEVSGPEVLSSERYLQRVLNPTPWSSRVLPAFRNNVRGACRIAFSRGHAMGGFMLSIRLEASEGRSDELDHALVSDLLPGLVELPHLCGVHYAINDVTLTAGNSGQQRGRVINLPERVIFIEGVNAEGVRLASQSLLSKARLEGIGARADIKRDLYLLEYSIQNLVASAH